VLESRLFPSILPFFPINLPCLALRRYGASLFEIPTPAFSRQRAVAAKLTSPLRVVTVRLVFHTSLRWCFGRPCCWQSRSVVPSYLQRVPRPPDNTRPTAPATDASSPTRHRKPPTGRQTAHFVFPADSPPNPPLLCQSQSQSQSQPPPPRYYTTPGPPRSGHCWH
jgi:hypothetical protein